MTVLESFHQLGRLCCAGLLPFMLCQCQMVEACIGFLERHSSKGQPSRAVGSVPAQAITREQFFASQAHRGLSAETLEARFRVADANGDGILTPQEVEAHQAAAAMKKKQSRADG